MKQKYKRWKLYFEKKALAFAQRHPKEIRLIDITKQRMIAAEVGNSSCVVAYYFLLSMFPLVIMLGSAISFIHLSPTEVLPYLKQLFPTDIYQLLEGTIVKLLSTTDRGGLFTVAAVMTFWAASKSVNGLQRAMNKAYGVEKRKNFIIARLFSFSFIIILFFFILFVALAFSIGTFLLTYIHRYIPFDPRFIDLFTTVKWPVTIMMMFLVMLIIYRLVPNAKVCLHQVWRGALFSTVGWLALAQLFGRFAHHLLVRYSSYGMIGTMMVIILWLKLAAIIIVLGGVINAVTTELKEHRIQEGNDSFEQVVEQIKRKTKELKKEES